MAMRAFGASVIVSGGMGYGGVWAASGVHDIRAMASLAEMCLGVWICLGRSFLVPRIAACLGASLFLWHVISYSLGLSCGCFPGTPRGYARVVGFSFAMLGLVAGLAVWKRGVLLRLARWPSAACAVCLGCVACGWSWVSGGAAGGVLRKFTPDQGKVLLLVADQACSHCLEVWQSIQANGSAATNE